VDTVVSGPLLVLTKSPTWPEQYRRFRQSARNDADVETEVDAGRLDLGLAGLNLSLRCSNGCLRSLDLALFAGPSGCVINVLLADRIHTLPGGRTSPHPADS